MLLRRLIASLLIVLGGVVVLIALLAISDPETDLGIAGVVIAAVGVGVGLCGWWLRRGT